MEELLLNEADLPEMLREWLENAPRAAFALAVERLADGRVLLRPLPDVDPALLARIRVTTAKYHEALMNLT
jgi:hypothetical protein